MSELARILIYGDLHLSSKNYGAHRDYPNETLDILRKITAKASEIQATHIIGLGDFAFGRFNTLEYRAAVESELETQYNICNGNRFELKGNHDSAGYGMTEFEYYIQKGLIHPSRNLKIGQVNIGMVDFGKVRKSDFVPDPNMLNVVLAHDYFTFKDLNMPNFGKNIELDEFKSWFGVDHIICGHIHSSGVYEGLMVGTVDGKSIGKRVTLDYVGSMSRPAYYGESTDVVGHMVILTIYDNGDMKYDRIDVELLPISEAFNLEIKAEKEAKEDMKNKRLDITDIVQQLNSHERITGNPEDIIMGLDGVDIRFKKKAIELLKLGQA